MVLLFPALAAHLLQGDKTPLHALIWLDEFIRDNNVNKDEFQVYYDFFELAACTKKSAGTDSLMALQCKPNLQPSKKFCSWMKKRLEGVGAIGTDSAVVTPQRAGIPPNTKQPPSQNAEDLKSLIAAVKVVNDSIGTTAAQVSKGGKSKQTTMSKRKAWKLAGMCGVSDLTKIPRVWIEMTQASTYTDARDLFVRALTREDQLLGAGIQRPVVFESQIKRLLSGEFTPDEAFSAHNAHEAVMGFTDCLPKAEEEVRKQREHDETMKGTPEDARNYELIQKSNKIEKGKRVFAIDREAFRETLTDYAINRRVLFGPGNPHYENVWNMRRVINGWTRTERIQMLTPLNLRILKFRIEEDWFSFCSQDATEAGITGTIPNFPASYLEETVRDLARKVVLVPGNFPRDQLKIHQEEATPMGLLTPPRGSPPDFASVSFGLDSSGGDDSDDTPGDPFRKRGWHEYQHPTLRELTKNLRAKKLPIPIGRGLEQAGMKMNDIPKLKCKDSANPPRRGFCLRFALGNCNVGEGCNFCHVPGDQIPEEYLNKVTPHLTNLVKNGLEKLDYQKKAGSKKRRGVSGQNKLSFQE